MVLSTHKACCALATGLTATATGQRSAPALLISLQSFWAFLVKELFVEEYLIDDVFEFQLRAKTFHGTHADGKGGCDSADRAVTASATEEV